MSSPRICTSIACAPCRSDSNSPAFETWRRIVLDGEQPLPFERPFDRILVDVPCSGTGTLARHPEIRWKLHAEDLSDLHDRQARLLRNALPHLAPDGRLVYSTCSLEPEENEFVVREVLGALGDTFQSRRSSERHREHLAGVRARGERCFARTASFGPFLLSMGRMDFLPP